MRILAVDDDEIFLELLQSVLGQAGYDDIVCMSSARDAFEIARDTEREFECFLLDLVMPEIDGIQLCRELRKMQRYRSTPIIMVTAAEQMSNVEKSYEAGATDFLNKPLNGLELGARIRVAGLLNNSLRQSETTSDVCLTRAVLNMQSFAYGSRGLIALDEVEGHINSHALENQMLRFPRGWFMFHLLAFEIRDAEGKAANGADEEWEKLIISSAQIISRAFGGSDFSFSYVGAGRFASVIRSSRLMSTEKIVDTISDSILGSGIKCLTEKGYHIDVLPLDERRLWMAATAADAIRNFRDGKHRAHRTAVTAGTVDASRLFSKMDELTSRSC